MKHVSIDSEGVIQAHAFYSCTALEDITMWNDDANVDADAFSNCPNLKEKP